MTTRMLIQVRQRTIMIVIIIPTMKEPTNSTFRQELSGVHINPRQSLQYITLTSIGRIQQQDPQYMILTPSLLSWKQRRSSTVWSPRRRILIPPLAQVTKYNIKTPEPTSSFLRKAQ